jgi:hypothetical protein
MTLTKGDHLLIKRNGMVIVEERTEAYHEFEVLETPTYLGQDPEGKTLYQVKLKVIK